MVAVSPREYYHDQDRTALEGLKSLPGFTPVVKSFMKVVNERGLHAINMATKIRLGPNQLPRIYNLLPPICQKLGIEEPELYLEMNPEPNAYTYGDTQAFITVTSGLLECMEEDEIKVVLAHECGHIACHHVLYHTIGSMILSGSANFLDLGLVTVPLELAFFHWKRCSEFSCDRAAAICVGDYHSVVQTMMRLAGGPKTITREINQELFLQQAEEVEEFLGDSAWETALLMMTDDHPYTIVRAAEIKKWCESDQFQQIMAYTRRIQAGTTCSVCGADMEPHWAFCKRCGNKRR